LVDGIGSGSQGRLRLGMGRIVFTRGARRSLREALKGLGLVGAFTLELGGHGFGRRLR
jgi:hypothetical protein